MEPIPEANDNMTNYEKSVMTDVDVICYDPNVSKGKLLVYDVDLKIKDNTKDHNTDKYDITSDEYYDNVVQFVGRRGQSFEMEIQFDRLYNKTEHDVRLVFEFGDKMPSKGSRVELKPCDKATPNKWCAVIKSSDGNKLVLSVWTPPDCAVAKWSLKIDVVVVGDEKTKTKFYRYKHPDPIYILFNPWCGGDEVCMNTEESMKEIDEYVINEDGELYRGSQWSISPCYWEFGQFSGKVLECVMYLLDSVSDIGEKDRGDPRVVTRGISSLVNNCDNNGVLAGKWASDPEEYSDGKKPWEWVASTSILEQYYKTKQPVKYGQCWVFSALVTTVCRALGIPTRSVTNFASAHDTDGSITIDEMLNSEGKKIEGKGDSVWNFHVWNECWMARPDLPPGYDGWQAIDATPQERSKDKFQMGPMPLKAVKEGNMNCQYDGPFLFGEVNGDQVTWAPDGKGNVRVTEIETGSVGKKISTKKRKDKEYTGRRRLYSYYCPNRLDITHLYKYPEGSEEERAAVKRASKKSTKPEVYTGEIKEYDVAFKLELNDEKDEKNEKIPTNVGDTIKLCLIMTNKGENERYIRGNIQVESTDYRGKSGNTLLDRPLPWGQRHLEPKGEKRVLFEIPVEDYCKKLVDQYFIKASCLCSIRETDQLFSAHKTIELLKPDLTIKAPEKGKVKEMFKAEASFVNPLPCVLTGCEITVEGPGLQIPSVLAQIDVAANETFAFETEFTPVKSGKRAVIMLFNSNELHGIQGEQMIELSK